MLCVCSPDDLELQTPLQGIPYNFNAGNPKAVRLLNTSCALCAFFICTFWEKDRSHKPSSYFPEILFLSLFNFGEENIEGQ